MRHRVSMRQIEGFLLASQSLSFSRAAESMHITQSAFSQLIKELESTLGLQLFVRTTRNVQLTAAGEAMYQKVRRGLDAIDEACDEAEAVARIDRGHIRVGTLASVAVGVVTRTLARLRDSFPGVTVSMREDFNDALVDLVASGETDLTICSEINHGWHLAFEYLFDDEILLVAPAGSPLARLAVVGWDAVGRLPLVLTARRTATRQHVAARLAAHGISKPVEHEVASTPTALAMVRVGFGATFVSQLALQEADMRGLRASRLEDPPIRRMGIYRRMDRAQSAAGEKFQEMLRLEVAHTMRRLRSRRPRPPDS